MTTFSATTTPGYFLALGKRFLAIYLPLLLLLCFLSYTFFATDQKTRAQAFARQEVMNLNQQQRIIANDIRSITTDMQLLANNYSLHEHYQGDHVEDWTFITQEFLIFADNKKLYDQIRFLDKSGMEKIRINYNAGNSSIVPPAELQDKSKRYYFQDTISLRPGEVFVSPCDLNIEHDAIERPLKPMIRFGAPVSDRNGEIIGMVMLNYLARETLNNIASLAENSIGKIMLLNREGYWLLAPDPEDEWGFMFPEKKERTFGRRFPLAWSKIAASDSGQFTDKSGMFTHVTVRPLGQGLLSSTGSPEAFAASSKRLKSDDYTWKLVSFTPADTLERYLHPDRNKYIVSTALIALLLGIGCGLAARNATKNAQAETALEESEEKFRTVAEFPYDWEYWLDPEGNYYYTSPSCERITGCTAEELSADPGLFRSLIHPEDRESVDGHLREHLQTTTGLDQPSSLDYRIITRSGEEKWLSHTCQSVFSATGTYLGRRASDRDVTERKQAEGKLKRLEWMLSDRPAVSPADQQPDPVDQGYGDLTLLNRNGIIRTSIDNAMLLETMQEYQNVLETSGAIYETNGDYATGIFSSRWCRLLDRASRKLCRTDDNVAALNSGQWLCHESCWTCCSKESIAQGVPVDIECNGGIRLYAVPIFAGNEVIGSINFGHGEPPRDPARLKEIADLYQVDYEELCQEANAYDPRPPYIIAMAKRRLQSTARLIGELVGRKRAEAELRKLNEDLEERVRERTAALEKKSADLENANKAFVGRELRMIELKEKIAELEKKNRD